MLNICHYGKCQSVCSVRPPTYGAVARLLPDTTLNRQGPGQVRRADQRTGVYILSKAQKGEGGGDLGGKMILEAKNGQKHLK